ncbi:MAG: hypothetical protein L7S63_02275, partial [Flavobacteriales bacterium]|nr:hypothetical protein [Flavobacteriales bacterium]
MHIIHTHAYEGLQEVHLTVFDEKDFEAFDNAYKCVMDRRMMTECKEDFSVARFATDGDSEIRSLQPSRLSNRLVKKAIDKAQRKSDQWQREE